MPKKKKKVRRRITGKGRVVPYRRRREGRTNYKKRLKLVLSRKPRLVVRKFSHHISCQIIEYSKEGDRTLVSSHSRNLLKYGWKAGLKNIPAAYLTGLLVGLRAKKMGINEAVLDIGLHVPKKGGKLYACLKGAVDAGMEIPHDESIFPPEERINGSFIADYANKLSDENLKRRFSLYFKKGLDPKEIVKHFNEIKEKIIKEPFLGVEKKGE